MTTDPFTEAAAWQAEEDLETYLGTEDAAYGFRDGFNRGAKWGRDRALAQEPTDAEVEAACAGFYNDPSGLTDWTRLTSADQELADKYRAGMRRALSAARAARRDEEKR